jgi:predicted TIM-barrel fold metal-dependent hydrolase
LCFGLILVSSTSGQTAPVVDHHQHLFGPATATLISADPLDAGALIAHLDAAGIERAVVLSVAYTFGSPNRTVEHEYAQVRAANDWTSREVARFPDRLRGCCGLNPLRDYALEELARGAQDRSLRHGLKLHFGNSVVDYHDRRHIAQLQRVFRTANGYGMAIVVHMRASISRKLPYGRDEARIFLNELLPAAPDVPVQIAHLSGAGGYHDDPPLDRALSVFVEAIADRDPRVSRLLFDVATSVSPTAPVEELALIARRIRELGVERVLYGSDAPVPGNTPREGWAAFRKLPLSETEFRTIVGNVAPYMR